MITTFASPSAVDDMPAELPAILEQLADSNPAIGLALVRALGGADSPALRQTSNRLMEALATDLGVSLEVETTVSRALRAQEVFDNWPEERVDALLRDLAVAVADRAEALAIEAVRETGMGNVADKVRKNRFASLAAYRSLVGKVGKGVLSVDQERRVTEIASAVGVVFGVVPVTNPVGTAIFKTLIALKGRNALILSFHRRAVGVGRSVGAVIRQVLAAHGAPTDLVQCLTNRADRAITRRFMSHEKVSLIVATGSAGLVRAAYSSGTPAIGVGPGNAPALICADADLEEAARAIVESKAFDNGLICGAEHNLVVDDRVSAPFADALARHGAAVLTAEERGRFYKSVIDRKSRTLRREMIGQLADTIAAAVGISRPYPIRVIVIPSDAARLDPFSGGEKLAPVLSMFSAAGEDEALRLCRTLLDEAGAGHTAVIHSTNPARVDRFARTMPAGRILVNTQAAQGCCGMTTGLECSITLGCGTFGGNSTTDNVGYRHLLNIKRVAYGLEV
ncbi:MAG TPA: aldehyde dehydrogenase family protein [Vicinamibacterales bacterium]